MVILGVTGSIGMGKSTAAAILRRLGVPVHEADADIHRLLGPGGAALPAVSAAFPGVVKNGAVDRQKLGARVFGDPAALVRLEDILHPMVRRITDGFLRRHARRRAHLVGLDIPLLFETGGERRCDAVVVLSASGFLQRQRVLRRPGMTAEKLARIAAHQMSDVDKRRRADFVVRTGIGKRPTLRKLRRIVKLLHARRGRAWRPGYR
ncbi:MAG: dephospho-CoA kinase [Rhodospirillales bacterium]|nr:dephospho-CoA kinase [Rhodospirillales bacterium]